MKSRTFMALAVAGTFACGSAFAGGFKHHSSSHFDAAHEVQTPTSVNESAPWLANEMHGAGWSIHDSGSTVIGMQEGLHSDGPIGTSSSISGFGTGGFDSMSSSRFDSSVSGLDSSLGGSSGVEYWLWGSDSVGTSSSVGGSGSGGFDSTSSLGADDSFGMTDEYYLVSGPLAEFSGDEYILYESGTSSDDIAYLATLSEDFWVLSPIYEDMADASALDSGSNHLAQYSPLGSDDDTAT